LTAIEKAKQNLPADSKGNLNTERIVGGIEKVGNYFEEIKKHQKMTFIVTIGYLVFLVLLIGGIYLYGFAKGGLAGVIDLNAPIRKFDCTNGIFNDTVRSYEQARTFKEIFGGNCSLRFSKD
jgi:hypothetical protein